MANATCKLGSRLLPSAAICLAFLCHSTFICQSASAQNSLAIKGGRIIPITGDTIDSGIIVITDGKIVAIGTDINIPVDAHVIDATGKVVMPGFVEPHSSSAMSQANETNPNVPYVSVLDSIDPMRPYFDEARRNGVTSVAVVPGNTTMIGGQSAVVKTGGQFLDDMILKKNAGMKISLKPVGSGSRMGHLAALRKELDEAKKKSDPATAGKKQNSPDENEKAETKQEKPAGDNDGQQGSNRASQNELDKSMLDLVTGKLPAFIYCENASDVHQAQSLIKEYQLKPIMVLGKDCYKAAKLLADSNLPIILDSSLVFWENNPRLDEDTKIVATEAFRDHGIEFAFQVGRSTSSTLGNNYLWYQAATAVKYGMPIDQALKSLTMVPATFLGIDQFVGSLEVGKDGDLVILSGDPLKVNTWVETTIVNGEVVYEREKDEKLKLLLDPGSK